MFRLQSSARSRFGGWGQAREGIRSDGRAPEPAGLRYAALLRGASRTRCDLRPHNHCGRGAGSQPLQATRSMSTGEPASTYTGSREAVFFPDRRVPLSVLCAIVFFSHCYPGIRQNPRVQSQATEARRLTVTASCCLRVRFGRVGKVTTLKRKERTAVCPNLSDILPTACP